MSGQYYGSRHAPVDWRGTNRCWTRWKPCREGTGTKMTIAFLPWPTSIYQDQSQHASSRMNKVQSSDRFPSYSMYGSLDVMAIERSQTDTSCQTSGQTRECRGWPAFQCAINFPIAASSCTLRWNRISEAVSRWIGVVENSECFIPLAPR